MSGVIRDLHFNFKISPETSISRLTTPSSKLMEKVMRDGKGEGACIGKGFWV